MGGEASVTRPGNIWSFRLRRPMLGGIKHLRLPQSLLLAVLTLGSSGVSPVSGGSASNLRPAYSVASSSTRMEIFDNPQSFSIISSDSSLLDEIRLGSDRSRRSRAVAGIRLTQADTLAQVNEAGTNRANVTICVGSVAASGCGEAATKDPFRPFTIIDGQSTLPNVRALSFDDEQAGELAGRFAARSSRASDIILVVSGGPGDNVARGFERGVLRSRPSVRVITVPRGDSSPQQWTVRNLNALKRAKVAFISDFELLRFLNGYKGLHRTERRWLIARGRTVSSDGLRSVLLSIVRRYDVVIQDEIEGSAEMRRPKGVVVREDSRASIAPRSVVEVRYGVASRGVDVVVPTPIATKSTLRAIERVRAEIAGASGLRANE